MAGTSVTKLCEFPTNSALEDMRASIGAIVTDLENIRLAIAREWQDGVVYAAANSGAGAGMQVDANANDVETQYAIDIQHNGLRYPIAAQAAIDLSTKTVGAAATVGTSKSGALWIFAAPGGSIDAETDINTAAWTSAIQSLAQYSKATRTLPPAVGMVPFGVVQVTEGGSGPFTWGADSITAESETYYSFNGTPGIHTACASMAVDAAAPTFTYGAGKCRLGTGTLVSYTGKANVTLPTDTIATGKVGAYFFYVLADDNEIAVQYAATYTSLEAARSAVRSRPKNPLMPMVAAIYIANGSTGTFTGGTTNLDATGITVTFDISPALTTSIDQYSDFTGYAVNRLE